MPIDDPGARPGAGAADREAQYQAWAERMRTKRATAKERIRATQEPARETGERIEGSGYWTTDALFAESRRVSADPSDERRGLDELLAVLDLRDGADPDQIGAAYRRLAKEHHPDRHAADDEATRAFHEARMREITLAYRALRQRQEA